MQRDSTTGGVAMGSGAQRVLRPVPTFKKSRQDAHEKSVEPGSSTQVARPHPAIDRTHMPLGYHISPDQGLITVQGAGAVSVPELTRLGESLLSDDGFDPGLPQLLDFRGLRPVRDADGAAVTHLQTFVQQRYRGRVQADVAVVIDEHLESRHCADIYLLTCAIHDAELFADYDQALRWLMRRAFAGVPLSAEQQDGGCDDPDGAPE